PGERVGGAASASRVWLALSSVSAIVLAVFFATILAWLHAGFDSAKWKMFVTVNSDYGCCRVRHEVPLHWDSCSVAIGDVFAIRSYGHTTPEPTAITSTLSDCPAADLVSLIGAGVAMPAIPQRVLAKI